MQLNQKEAFEFNQNQFTDLLELQSDLQVDYSIIEIAQNLQQQELNNQFKSTASHMDFFNAKMGLEIQKISQSQSNGKIPKGEQNCPLNQEIMDIFKELLQAKAVIAQLSYVFSQGNSNQQENKKQNQLSQDMYRFRKVITIRQSQLGMLVLLLSKGKSFDIDSQCRDMHNCLGKFAVPFQHQINTQALAEVFQYEKEFLVEHKSIAKDLIRYFKQKLRNKYLESKLVNRLKVLSSKIISVAQTFPYACAFPKDDLLCLSKQHNRWKKLETIITRKSFGDTQFVKKEFDKLKSTLNIVNATMSVLAKNSKGFELKKVEGWKNMFQAAGQMYRVMFFEEQAKQEAELMISEGDNALAKQIWNLPDRKIIKQFISKTLPDIKFTKKHFIPRLFKEYLDSFGTEPLPQILVDDVKQYQHQLFKEVPYTQRLMLRINSPKSLKFNQQDFLLQPKKETSIIDDISNFFKSSKKKEPPQQIIYHIHGGGFISMSTFIHQSYTRVWANELKVPIVSVEYGKAPQHPFPQGLYDCFQGYMWLLYTFRQIYNVNPQKIVIVGDSAGGNLAAALTTLLIQLKLRKPDGLILAYPALSLNAKSYTPSLLKSLNDMILPHTFLKVCLGQYLKGSLLDPDKNSLISPSKTADHVLQLYPHTQIFVGSMDPCHDECCRFAERLNDANPLNAQLTIIDDFPHGFLQFDMKTQPHELSRKATKLVEQGIKLELKRTGKSISSLK